MHLFTQQLLEWWETGKRDLPWKNTTDPYLIWLSEIILQQTRVEQGLPYYERLTAAFPTVTDLAHAPQDQLMLLWEGLGYYSRARNLHATAQYIAYDCGGGFPTTYDQLLALKGVGSYTAAAIASFAYGLPHAVVDGNVYRVLARYFGIHTPTDTTEGKKQFAQLAQQLLPTDQAASYNQAMMDFGATVCKPALPNCQHCPLQRHCAAYQQQTVPLLPIKVKKMERTQRFFHYLLLFHQTHEHAAEPLANAHIFIQKRIQKDIWQNLYELPLVETTEQAALSPQQLYQHPHIGAWLQAAQAVVRNVSGSYTQQLTHRQIIAHFWEIDCPPTQPLPTPPHGWLSVPYQQLHAYALPQIINRYIAQRATQPAATAQVRLFE